MGPQQQWVFARKHRRENSKEDLGRRAAREVRQVELGESAGRQALEGESVAPSTLRTLRALTDPHVPRARIALDSELCSTNLRQARRGAAGGPSGMTAEHLKGLLEGEDDSLFLAELENKADVQPDVPADIMRALRLGRTTALQKPDNGWFEQVRFYPLMKCWPFWGSLFSVFLPHVTFAFFGGPPRL